MSQMAQHPAYLQVEDLLDAVGQRYRVFVLARGGILLSALAAGATVVAALLAGLAGPGVLSAMVMGLYVLTLLAGAIWWVVRPLIMRPRPLAMARMIENRVTGVHNGLTNVVLLAQADDLTQNPWMGEVFSEVATNVTQRPVADAVRYKDLRRPALVSWGIALPLLVIGMIFAPRISQGFGQMLRPRDFVPILQNVQIVDVLPGDTTVIKGRSLEVSAATKGEGDYNGLVVFEDESQPHAMAAAGRDDSSLRRFTFVRNHVDDSTRYRVEVGGTQSRWYTLTAVRQVAMTSVTITATPPAYTKVKGTTQTIPAAELTTQALSYPQGTKLELAFGLDVPVTAAMLQAGDGAPAPTAMSETGKRFAGQAVLQQASGYSLLLTDGSGQIIARVPEQPLRVQCVMDGAPAVEMEWPAQDVSVAPVKELRIKARLKDDYGLGGAKLLWSTSADEPMASAAERMFADKPAATEFTAVLALTPEQSAHGKAVWVQVEASDNRDLLSISNELGPQTTHGKRVEIRFRDPAQIAKEDAQRADKLHEQLQKMLALQKDLHERTLKARSDDVAAITAVLNGQSDLKTMMLSTAQTFEFDAASRIVQKTLQVLAGGPANEAVEFARALSAEKSAPAQAKLADNLQARQRRVIQTLESLLAMLKGSAELSEAPAKKRAGDMDSPAEAFKALQDALKEFQKEEQRILDQTASLAKKPIDNFDENDRKLLEDLKMAQEKLDAFMQQKINDFSNVAEQDMANASLLRELLEVYTEVTMAKDALNEKAVEIAVAAEENGLELAKEISSNLEKWLLEKPDRQKWTQEDQLQRTEAPMPELPTELEDMIGDLMEQQEDLFDEMEDANANWHDSPDKGAGWDAADGPIDSMSAKGVTGNTLPNNNEMGGRAGEGRSAKSQGEMVEETATGKGGRNTPTRLDPTAFQQGQIKDTSKDPTGGATGGGKLSGQGGAGLEGPVGPKIKQQMDRLAQKQAELRNSAERLNLQYKVGAYDNFKLLESVAIMRRMESDLKANRYQNAMRRKDILLDAMDNSHTLVGGRISVQHDTTPTGNRKLQQEINDAMKGSIPPAWESALKEYYRKLGQE